MQKGRIIFLSGVTSSGKTSIVEAIQAQRNILVLANDLFEQCLGDRWLREDYWAALPRVIWLMYRTARLFSDAGQDVLIDGILVERPEMAPRCARMLEIFAENPLSIVEVARLLEICRQRNLQRGDRYESQSAEQSAMMAKDIPYALRVETDKLITEECAEIILRTLL